MRDFLGEVSDNEVDGLFNNLESRTYVRPIVEQYRMTVTAQVFANQYLVDAPMATVAQAILTVVEMEAPLHIKDLTSRVAGMWGQRSGNNIMSRIEQVCQALEQHKRLDTRGEFIWKSDGAFSIRSRKDIGIPIERIAPEEIQEAILQVLRAGQGFTRQELVNEARAVFGFSRTGQALQQVLNAAIENLLASGLIGEGSLGISLRN